MATYGRLVLPSADPVIDNTGLLNVGATMTVFLTGTDDLATVYSDPTGVTTIENPLTSDAAGRFYDDSTEWCVDVSAAYDVNLVLTTGTTFFYSQLFALGAAVDTSGFLENPDVMLTGNPTAPTPAANDSSSSIATTAFVQAALGLLAIFPSGMIVPFAMTSLPTGWLLCDGSAVSRTTYAALFGAIGTTYGIGDGTTTFNLPNLQGYFVRGQNSTGSGPDPSRAFGSTQTDQFQGHYHTTLSNGGFWGRNVTSSGVRNTSSGTDTEIDASTAGPITDGTNGTPRTGLETRPANVAMAYAIRT